MRAMLLLLMCSCLPVKTYRLNINVPNRTNIINAHNAFDKWASKLDRCLKLDQFAGTDLNVMFVSKDKITQIAGKDVDAWAIGNDIYIRTDIPDKEVRALLLHEIGHVLGLDHTGRICSSIMDATICVKKITSSDVEKIKRRLNCL